MSQTCPDFNAGDIVTLTGGSSKVFGTELIIK